MSETTDVKVRLIPRAVEALSITADRLGLSKTDTVNRALQSYEQATRATTTIGVAFLRAGDVVRYGEVEFTVAEVLPLAILGGDAIIGIAADGTRHVLVYANQDSAAELVHAGGA